MFFIVYNLVVFLPLDSTGEICLAMINFSSLKNKLNQSITSIATSVLVFKCQITKKMTTTSFKEEVYGGVVWDSSKYSEQTKAVIYNLSEALNNRDKSQIYCSWLFSATNHKNCMPYHNKDLINRLAMLYNYNFPEMSYERLSEQEFLRYWGIPFNNSTLSKDLRFPYFNLNETLAMEYINRLDIGLFLKRNIDNNLVIPNLGLQPNNDCIGLLIKHPITGFPKLYYIDIKNTNLVNIIRSLENTNMQGKSMHLVKGSGQRFGCNIFVIATSEDKDVILSINEKAEMLSFLNKMSTKYPEIYLGLTESIGFKNFESTGNWKYLNDCGYPVPFLVKSGDLITKEVIKAATETEEYKKLLQKIPQQEYNEKFGLISIDDSN